MITSGQKLGCEIAEIIGLDASKTSRIQIDLSAGEVASVVATIAITQDQGEEIGQAIKRYKLVELEENARSH